MNKRITAALLLLAMIFAATACGTTTGDSPPTPTIPPANDIALSNVYTETELISFEASLTNPISNLVYSNGRIYFDIERVEQQTPYKRIISALPDGSDQQFEWELIPEAWDTITLQYFTVDAVGNIWTLTKRTEMNTSDPAMSTPVTSHILTKYSGGEELASCDISAVGGLLLTYPRGLKADAEGNVYIQDMMAVHVFDGKTAQYSFSLSESSQIVGMAKTDDGSVAYLLYYESAIKVIDFALQSSEGFATDSSRYITAVFDGFDGFDCLYTYLNGLWGYDRETAESVQIIDFLNSDLAASSLTLFCSTEDREFIAYKPRSLSGGMLTSASLVRLSYNPDARTGGKTILTLGVVTTLDDVTRDAVIKFNKTSTTARIEIVDYSKYTPMDSIMGGAKQFDLDLLAGKAPDIFGLALGYPPEKYIDKGALEDLTPYLENDPKVGRDDLFENILKLGEHDGRIYHIIPVFSTLSLIGKASIFGDGNLTFQEFLDVCDTFPDSQIHSLADRAAWLNMNINLRLGNFVNWIDGTVNFANGEFYALLESGKRFPEALDYLTYAPVDYTSNSALITSTALFDAFYARYCDVQFGEAVVALNFKSDYGDYGTSLFPATDLAINAASEHKALAWEFISGIISDEEYVPPYGVSINKNMFENRMACEMTPLAERDYSKGVMLYPTGGASWPAYSYEEIDPVQYAGYELTEAEVSRVRKHIESASQVLNRDDTIINIIQEEAAAYYGGVRSAEEAAQLIESRVRIYVNEHK